jgi:hypothetical protein
VARDSRTGELGRGDEGVLLNEIRTGFWGMEGWDEMGWMGWYRYGGLIV